MCVCGGGGGVVGTKIDLVVPLGILNPDPERI